MISVLITGCSVGKSLIVRSVQPFFTDAMASIMTETDPEIARPAMATELKLLEGMILSSPNDRKLLTMAAQGFAGYAMLFYDQSDPEKAKVLYSRGLQYGRRALSNRDEVFIQPESRFEDFEKAIGSLRDEDIGTVYWTAIAWGGWINVSRTNPMALAEFPRVRLLMDWVAERNERYFFSGTNWFYGVYYSTLPPIVGGDTERSKLYFDKAIGQTEGRFLWGKLYYAQTYAVQTLNRPFFEKLLNEILDTETGELPEANLLNEVAKARAIELLKQADELFY